MTYTVSGGALNSTQSIKTNCVHIIKCAKVRALFAKNKVRFLHVLIWHMNNGDTCEWCC